MIKNLRWKIITILVVAIVFFGIGIYPILADRYSLPAPGWLMAKQLKLGLDLKGGVYLEMRVHTDEALRTFTTTSSEQLRETLRTGGVAVSSIALESDTSFRVEGVPARDLRGMVDAIQRQIGSGSCRPARGGPKNRCSQASAVGVVDLTHLGKCGGICRIVFDGFIQKHKSVFFQIAAGDLEPLCGECLAQALDSLGVLWIELDRRSELGSCSFIMLPVEQRPAANGRFV